MVWERLQTQTSEGGDFSKFPRIRSKLWIIFFAGSVVLNTEIILREEGTHPGLVLPYH